MLGRPFRDRNLVKDAAVFPLHFQEPGEGPAGFVEDVRDSVVRFGDAELAVGELVRSQLIEVEEKRRRDSRCRNELIVIPGVVPSAGDIFRRRSLVVERGGTQMTGRMVPRRTRADSGAAPCERETAQRGDQRAAIHRVRHHERLARVLALPEDDAIRPRLSQAREVNGERGIAGILIDVADRLDPRREDIAAARRIDDGDRTAMKAAEEGKFRVPGAVTKLVNDKGRLCAQVALAR